jgi:EmrB/QacA subfamily drug resistance transporter
MSGEADQLKRVALVVAGALFMQNLDTAIINTSLPQLAASFAVSPVDTSVAITAYILSMAAFLPGSGYLSARFGARAVFASAVALFTTASIGCALARTLPLFVLARVAQGMGGAMMVPVGRVLVLHQAPRPEIVRAMWMISWPALTAPVIAPVLGGAITTYLTWRWNFLLNVPFGLLVLVLVRIHIPPQTPEGVGRFDTIGFVLSTMALACLLYALQGFGSGMVHSSVSVALLALGVIAAWASVRHFRRVDHPLVDLSVLSLRTFRLCTFGPGMVVRMVISTSPFLLPMLFQVGFGATAAASGLLLSLYYLGNVTMKSVTTAALRGFGFRRVLVVNGVLASLAIGCCVLLRSSSLTITSCLILLWAGSTRSLQFTSLSALQFADVPRPQLGRAANLSAILQQIGTAAAVGFSAILLQVMATLRGGGTVGLADVRLTLVTVAGAGVLAALAITNLAPSAGSELSGHRAA